MNAIEAMFQNLKFAARSLAARPALALTVVATLALGIGANCAIQHPPRTRPAQPARYRT